MNRHPEINPRDLIDPKCDGHLANWANWMHECKGVDGYGSKSAVVTGYGSTTIDEMYEAMDKQHAEIIDAIIGGLPQVQICAIHNVYLSSVWKSGRGADMVETFIMAAAEVWRMAKRRGLE